MRTVVVFFLLICSTLNSFGQEKNPTFQYGGMQQLGVVVESISVRFLPNLINGVRYKDKWFAGIGVGYEIRQYQGWPWNAIDQTNTMPLYLDIRHYFFKKKWFCAVADIGTNLVVGNDWMVSDESNLFKKSAGYYGNIGCGIKSKFCGKTYYSFDVSYNFKQTRYSHDSKDWQDRWTESDNNFKQRRILIRLGLEI